MELVTWCCHRSRQGGPVHHDATTTIGPLAGDLRTMSDAALKFFTHGDCPPGALADERIAVLGYGNLGRSLALNLRDSGVTALSVGNIEDISATRARADGFRVTSLT